jgi:hypothetical protein
VLGLLVRHFQFVRHIQSVLRTAGLRFILIRSLSKSQLAPSQPPKAGRRELWGIDGHEPPPRLHPKLPQFRYRQHDSWVSLQRRTDDVHRFTAHKRHW